MNKDKTLLIMAAGMGSRFGGLKQIEPVGPNGEFLIDYSIYDALRTGFNKVVFIIKKEHEQIFKETIGVRVEKHIKVEYAFQELTDIPEGYSLPVSRTKPIGTAHAVYAARNFINEPFAVINADDFYGRNGYEVLSNFLDNDESNYSLVGYLVKNTLSENGSVKRGVCSADENNNIEKIVESVLIEEDGIIRAESLNTGDKFEVDSNSLVSMNLMGFRPNVFPFIEKKLKEFLSDKEENLIDREIYIPDIIFSAKNESYAEVKLLKTTAVWKGITYKEDRDDVLNSIKNLVEEGEYPNNLWD
jgi:dTDP-glucose pyrophosphorylase